MSYDSVYPTFRPATQARNRLRARVASKLSCADAPLVNAIPSSVMDAGASSPTMNTTTGSASGAVAAPAAGRPSPFFHCFLSLTPTTVCWRALRHCDGALWSTAPGKRPRLRSKTRIAYPILPRFAAGAAAPNRLFPFSTKRSSASLTGWRPAIRPISKLGLCLG